MTLVSTVGGAAGPLYGTFFLEMGKAAAERTTLTTAEWAGVVSAGVAGVQMRGKAEPGDKTMVDALLPAAAALRAAAGSGASLPAACRAAADAAAEGMRATTPLVARKGRASYLGERSAGHQDPGATSSWLLLETAATVFGGGASAAPRAAPPARTADAPVVGLVIVSHSSRLAEGVVELAAQMAGPDVRIGAAGGLDEPGGALGTDAAKVLRAIDDVWSEDGVLVLMDLGSAVLSAELALDLLDEERRARVRLTAAPLVEGAVAAAVAAGLGDPLEAVAAAARGGLAAKASQLAEDESDGAAAETATERRARRRREPRAGAHEPPDETLTVTVLNALGLHARPAALLVRTAAGFDAGVQVRDATNGRGPVSARSLNGVATLGARQGDELVLTASGTEAAEALDAVRRLADEGFGELGEASAEAPGRRRPARRGGARRRPRQERPAAPAPETAAAAVPPPAGTVLTGLPAAPGVAAGPARPFRRAARTLPQGPAADPDAEWSALQQALAATAAEIRRARAGVAGRAGDKDAAIFDAHLLFLDDEALLEPARDAVFARREPAARAWAEAVAAAAAEWDTLEDAYQRARAADLRAVGDQVLANLARPEDSEADASELGRGRRAGRGRLRLPASSWRTTSARPTSPASTRRPWPASPAPSAGRRRTP